MTSTKGWEQMKVKRTVHITPGDQEKGLQYCPAGCPAALAIKRAFPELWDLSVTGYTFFYRSPSAVCRVSTPAPLLRYLTLFDNAGRQPDPPSFELELDI